MAAAYPRIDERHAAHLAQQVEQLLRHYVPEWQGGDPQAQALIAVFARFGELIIERLNRVPEKNLLAFLDLLGASLAPPQPARVPLTFSLAEGGTLAARVSAGTQVATALPAADGEPVIFETERDLVVTPARLAAAIVHDPAADRYRDLGAALGQGVAGGMPAFDADTPLLHAFYVDIEPVVALAKFDSLNLMMEFERAADPVPLPVAWDAWDGADGIALTHGDGSLGMSEWGGFAFSNLVPPPRCSVAGAMGRWLRCRLTAPVTAAQLPGPFSHLRLETRTRLRGQVPEHACADKQVLDLGQECFPFGERPRFGSTFYLASPLFGRVNGTSTFTLVITVTDPKAYVVETAGLQSIPDVRAKPTLAWEAWDGDGWQALPGLADGTAAFTRSGIIEFAALPYTRPARPCKVNGLDGYWVRARITGGDYGREAVHRPGVGTAPYQVEPATLVPPSIGRPTIDTEVAPGAIVRRAATCHHLRHRLFESRDGSPTFRPFERAAGDRPALYLGFELPEGSGGFAEAPVALHARVTPTPAGLAPDIGALPPRIVWEHPGANGTSALIVRDETQAFSRSGAIEWMPPDEFTARHEFGERPLHWIRARWAEGVWRSPPRLERLLGNTVSALQCATITDEVLGSSNGDRQQRFACSHAPVFAGTTLRVREPERPTALELEALRRDAGLAAGRLPELLDDESSSVWVPWHEVTDFHASGPRDRHYGLDSQRGEIRFGDGSHGLVPPPGSANVRLARYRSGGGVRGNLGEHSVTQLRTTIAYVDSVTNHLPAEGGADAEALDSLLERAPRSVRHGGRAVTRDDFEDLAQLASPEVARAKCVPLWDVPSTPLFLDSQRETLRKPGCLTLIVVPRSADARPMPSRELVERVRSHLDARRLATATLHIVGPRYLQVDIEAEVVPASLEAASGLETTVVRALAAFLHPLSGGFTATGWPWGRRPHESDFHRCIGAVPGVDHVHSLAVTERPEIQDLTDTDHFLVRSGTHRVRLRPAAPPLR